MNEAVSLTTQVAHGANIDWNKVLFGVLSADNVDSVLVDAAEPNEDIDDAIDHTVTFEVKVPVVDVLEELEEIGRGSFGVVRRGWASIGGDRVAVALKVAQSQDRSAVDDIGREVARLVSVAAHPNVVGVFGVARIGGVVRGGVAVFEYCNGGALVDALYGDSERRRAFDANELMQVAIGCGRGVAHLHLHGIVHRDIAARNVLLSESVAKVSDFGMARLAGGEDKSIERGAVRWMAPEVFTVDAKQNRISFGATSFDASSDVSSFGVLLFEIFVRERPWGVVEANVAVAKKVVAGKRLVVPYNVPETVRSLMSKCWTVLPSDRPTMAAVRDDLERLVKHNASATTADDNYSVHDAHPLRNFHFTSRIACSKPQGPRQTPTQSASMQRTLVEALLAHTVPTDCEQTEQNDSRPKCEAIVNVDLRS